MMDELLKQFILESRDYVQRIGEILIQLEQEGSSEELINELFRIFHTLKGNSGLFNFPSMTKMLHASEDLLNLIKKGQLQYDTTIADHLLEVTDIISAMLDEIETEGAPSSETNELAENKSSQIRNIISGEKESSVSEDKPLEKTKEEVSVKKEKEKPKFDYAVIPEEIRQKMVELLFKNSPVYLIRYVPEEECFYKGEDPFYLVKNTPGFMWGRAYLREKAEDLLTYDVYRCITNFEVIASIQEDELKKHFEYVLDQVEIFSPDVEDLIIPMGDKNGGAIYEDFVEEFEKFLKEKNIEALKKSIQTMLDLTSSELFVASCLRWLNVLVDYLPQSEKYILALLKSIKTLEPPVFKEVTETIEIKETRESREIESEAFKILETQKVVLEKIIASSDTSLRNNTLKAITQVIENTFISLNNPEILKLLEEAKNEGIFNSPEKLKDFIDRITREFKVPAEEVEKKEKLEAKEPVKPDSKKVEPKKDTLIEKSKPIVTKVLRVDEEKVDRLMNLVGELVIAKNGLLYLAKKIDTEFKIAELSKEMKSQYSVINKIAEEMQYAVMQIRMVPVSTVFQRFPRLVRDVSKKLGKKVKLVIEGEETEADKNVIEALAEPLIHLIRNGLDHGIETPEERVAMGKPETGTITLRAKQEGDQVIIEVKDDGRGIDPEKVKRKAYEKGLISEEVLEKLTDEEAVNLIFLPGFSTKEKPSEISGRGVGMDVVKEMVERFNGNVSLFSKKGLGTTVTISLPLSMAVSHVMLIESAGKKFGIPIESIVETVRIAKENIHDFKGNKTVSLRGRVIPLFFLNQLLDFNVEHLTNEEGEYAVMVLNIRNELVGVVVDKFLGTADIILKPLPDFINFIKIFSGTAIMGDGSVLLIINPKELI